MESNFTKRRFCFTSAGSCLVGSSTSFARSDLALDIILAQSRNAYFTVTCMSKECATGFGPLPVVISNEGRNPCARDLEKARRAFPPVEMIPVVLCPKEFGSDYAGLDLSALLSKGGR